jgi:hypothetical protein
MNASIPEIRNELKHLEKKELEELCLKLAKFKKENKELLAYQLFLSGDEEYFIDQIKVEINTQFSEINRNHYYYIKKSVRKILRYAKKYIRFSKQKETEIAILSHFLHCLAKMKPDYSRNSVLRGIYQRELLYVKRCISQLHPDLQLDYRNEIEKL